MIAGSLVALVTPMHPDGSLDWNSLDALVEFHLNNATGGIVAVGTTGESATLSPEEHCQVIERVVTKVAGKIPVIAGTGANSTTEAIELTQAAKNFGADACLLVSPYYNKPTQEGLYQHHKAIAEAVDIAQILYNVPGRTAVDMSNETASRLADIPNLVGIKDATGDIARGRSLIALLGERMAVFSGDDPTAYELILAGAKGNISVTANILPALMSDLCRLAADNQAEAAKALNTRLLPVHDAMFVESNPIPVKYALAKMGLMADGIRLPLTRLASPLHQQVDKVLQLEGLI